MGKNSDPVLIFKNATKMGQKRGLVTKKVEDNPTVKNDVFKDYLMIEKSFIKQILK